MVTHLASSLAQDRESSPAETSVLTTMIHRQLGVSFIAATYLKVDFDSVRRKFHSTSNSVLETAMALMK